MTTIEIGTTRLTLLQGDITLQGVDAVVNAANSTLMGGGGVDGAIHRKGGPDILKACKAIRRERYQDGLPTGEAVTTPAGNLPARYVIHTVGPVWQGGHNNEARLLAKAYRNSLQQAMTIGARTIAFPAISTGVYAYPHEEAATIAVTTTTSVIRNNPEAFDDVKFVLFTIPMLHIFQRAAA